MLSRTWLSGWLMVAVAGLSAAARPSAAPSPAAPSPAALSPARPAPTAWASAWQAAPEFARLFTPRNAPAGAYAAYTSRLTLEAALQQIHGDPPLAAWPGAWSVRSQGPFDAFGQGGSYNRWQVAQAYGGRPARVSRGPRIEDGRVVESWTLISPYPDAGLRRLETGTLLLVLRLR